ncbi:hypothetical protein PFISCL1PPCAC_8295, partial [Pristionchus fissidentatus]
PPAILSSATQNMSIPPHHKFSAPEPGEIRKTSFKENLAKCMRSPSLMSKREAAKRKWSAMRESFRLNRIKNGIQSSRLFSPRSERRRRSADGGSSMPAPSPSPTTRYGLSPNEWTFAFDHVITDADGRAQFTKFLQSEYSEENILFWWAVEELRAIAGDRPEFERTVQEMFDTFIAADSPLAINIDHDTRTDIIERVQTKTSDTYPENIYDRAQTHVYRLMEKDCFSRFVHTPAYKEVAKKLSLPQTFRFNGRLSPC